jgi:hypothetical protein
MTEASSFRFLHGESLDLLVWLLTFFFSVLNILSLQPKQISSLSNTLKAKVISGSPYLWHPLDWGFLILLFCYFLDAVADIFFLETRSCYVVQLGLKLPG